MAQKFMFLSTELNIKSQGGLVHIVSGCYIFTRRLHLSFESTFAFETIDAVKE